MRLLLIPLCAIVCVLAAPGIQRDQPSIFRRDLSKEQRRNVLLQTLRNTIEQLKTEKLVQASSLPSILRQQKYRGFLRNVFPPQDESKTTAKTIQYDDIPNIEKTLVHRMSLDIINEPKYRQFLNGPTMDQLLQSIGDFVRKTAQPVYKKHIHDKLASIQKYYSDYIEKIINKDKMSFIKEFLARLEQNNWDEKLSANLTVELDKHFDEIAMMLTIPEVRRNVEQLLQKLNSNDDGLRIGRKANNAENLDEELKEEKSIDKSNSTSTKAKKNKGAANNTTKAGLKKTKPSPVVTSTQASNTPKKTTKTANKTQTEIPAVKKPAAKSKKQTGKQKTGTNPIEETKTKPTETKKPAEKKNATKGRKIENRNDKSVKKPATSKTMTDKAPKRSTAASAASKKLTKKPVKKVTTTSKPTTSTEFNTLKKKTRKEPSTPKPAVTNKTKDTTLKPATKKSSRAQKIKQKNSISKEKRITFDESDDGYVENEAENQAEMKEVFGEDDEEDPDNKFI